MIIDETPSIDALPDGTNELSAVDILFDRAFTGDVYICLGYTGSGIDEDNLKLLHYNGGFRDDITSVVNTGNSEV
jgi:hypothetical protein